MEKMQQPTDAYGLGHEHSKGSHGDADVSVLGIFSFCVGLLVSAILIQGMIWLLFQYFSERESVRLAPEYPLAAGQETRLPPEPRLQTDPRADLQELRAHESSVLSSYGWVDRERRIVHIPIERAKQLYLSRQHGPGKGSETLPVSQREGHER